MHRIAFFIFIGLLSVAGLMASSVTPSAAASHLPGQSTGQGSRAGQMSYEQALAFVASQGVAMQTKQGVPNPHRGRHCWGCHTEGPPVNRDARRPKEPCSECHNLLTVQQERIAENICRTHGSICPVILRYTQPNGSMTRFFFGLK